MGISLLNLKEDILSTITSLTTRLNNHTTQVSTQTYNFNLNTKSTFTYTINDLLYKPYMIDIDTCMSGLQYRSRGKWTNNTSYTICTYGTTNVKYDDYIFAALRNNKDGYIGRITYIDNNSLTISCSRLGKGNDGTLSVYMTMYYHK